MAHCPVAIAYAVVTMDDASLYIDLAKVSSEIKESLKVRPPYSSVRVRGTRALEPLQVLSTHGVLPQASLVSFELE